MLTRSQIASLLAEIDKQESTLARQKAFLLSEDERLAAEEARARTRTSLTDRSPGVKVNVNPMMTEKHRVAISGGRSYKSPFQKACLEAGTTQGAVARAAGVTAAFLSMCVRGTKGAPLKLRKKAHDLVDWPLDGWKKLGE